MTREQIIHEIDELEQKKWFLELADDVNTKDYVDIGYRLKNLREMLKEESSDECMERLQSDRR